MERGKLNDNFTKKRGKLSVKIGGKMHKNGVGK